MDLIGLVDNIADATTNINFGRKAIAIKGREQEGRISYEIGIAEALSVFVEVQASADPYTIILAEYTFISQEFQLCDKTDKDALGSLAQAIQSFDDAFLVLQVVDDCVLYNAVDKAFPRDRKYRVGGVPKDAFHIACRAHKTRIKNILRALGVDPMEKTLLKQRFVNLAVAQNSYAKRQKKALIA